MNNKNPRHIMKGQMSLEMIIGLVILLVVAGIVISLFLNVFQGQNLEQLGQDTQDMQKVEEQCNRLCSNWKESEGTKSLSAAREYCLKTFKIDVNGDNSIGARIGNSFNSYCESGVHCFNVQSCETGRQNLNYEKCRKLLCEYYTKINGDPYSLGEPNNVHDHIAKLMGETSDGREYVGKGSCDLNMGDFEDSAEYPIANWYDQERAKYDFYQEDSGQLPEGEGGGEGPGLPSGDERSPAELVCEEKFKQ